MSTEKFLNTLNRIANDIVIKKYKYNDSIIIGDNTSGKSELLKTIMMSLNHSERYYIDSINRSFDVNLISAENNEISFDIEAVVAERLKTENFNLKDVFAFVSIGEASVPGKIETLYLTFSEEVEFLFKKFTGVNMMHQEKNKLDGLSFDGYEIIIKPNIIKISTGYQAIIRIFIELIYLVKSMQNKNLEENITVVIDEIAEFLSLKNQENIFQFLKYHFYYLNFIISTHSPSFIANAKDCNIIALFGENYSVFDSNDYRTVDDVIELLKNLNIANKKNNNATEIDIVLNRMYYMKLMNAWDNILEKEFLEINNETLSISQQILYKQIREW